MKLNGHLPKLTPADRYYTLTDKGYQRPRGSWTEISRDAKGTNIEFDTERLDVLADCVDNAVTAKNVRQVWAAIRHQFVDKVGYRFYGSIPSTVLALLGHNFMTVFDILRNQKGLGFMGGNGCGTKLHHLVYDKVTGVKQGLDPLVTEVAQAWFNLMLGELRYTRNEKKHLRDNIAEDELCLTINSRPRCQRTVRFWAAKGYPVLSLKEMPDRSSISGQKKTCAHCCEKGA